MSVTNDIVLYDFANSPCARRVKISLLEKGESFEREIVDLSTMEQKTPEYLRINPNGLVPAMSHNGEVLFESGVICDYLEDLFPQVSLYPEGLDERLQVRTWQDLELAMARDYRSLMYSTVMGPLHRAAFDLDEFLAKAARATDNPAHMAWEEKVWKLQVLSPEQQARYKKRLYQYLYTVEAALAGKHYLVAEQFTLADIATYPRLKMFPLVGISLDAVKYPNTLRWMGRMEQRRSFVETQSDEEKALLKLSKSGLLRLINHLVYTPEKQRSLVQRGILRILRPILRKKLSGITGDGAVQKRQFKESQPRPIHFSGTAGMMCLSETERGALRKAGSAKKSGLILFGSHQCPESRRLELLLRALGIPYRFEEGEAPPLMGLAQLPPPQLVHGQRILSNSLQAAEYLCGSDQTLALFRDDPLQQARIRMWNAFDTGMYKELQPFIIKQGVPNSDESLLYTEDQGRAILREKLLLLNEALADGQWLVGKAFSYADLALFTRLSHFQELGIADLLGEFPRIEAWLGACAEHVAGWDKSDAETDTDAAANE